MKAAKIKRASRLVLNAVSAFLATVAVGAVGLTLGASDTGCRTIPRLLEPSPLLTIAGYDQSARLWDPANGAAARILSSHANSVWGGGVQRGRNAARHR